ncbi:MAG: hypothetical protein WDN30_01420 [Pararobbsia sp.]
MKQVSAQKISIKQQIEVCLGQAGISLGQLTYVRQGQRENTTFACTKPWPSGAQSQVARQQNAWP